jgi:hypothetical protein
MTCRSIHAAAAAVAETVKVDFTSQQQAAEFAEWLKKETNTAALQHLKLGVCCGTCRILSPAAVSICIPWYNLINLQSLELGDSRLQLQPATAAGSTEDSSSSASSSNPFTALTALTSLAVAQCSSADFGSGLSQLAALSALQHLRLSHVVVKGCGDYGAEHVADAETHAFSVALGNTLGQLEQLTELAIYGQSAAWYTGALLDGAVFSASSRLSKLQWLSFSWVGTEERPVLLQQLPSSVTSLDISSAITSSQRLSSSSSSSSGGWQFPVLVGLHVSSAVFDPAALPHMPQLQRLEIDATPKRITPARSRMPDVLTALFKLQHLQELKLHELAGAAAAEQYAALTASSLLECLHVTNFRIAEAAAQHMFGPERPLPKLKYITITGPDNFGHNWPQPQAVTSRSRLPLHPGDISRLVSSCPGLRGLGFVALAEGVTADGAAPLLQLPLWSLNIGSLGFDDAVAEQVLAKMTGGCNFQNN